MEGPKSDQWADIILALAELIETLVGAFGPWGTVGFLMFLFVLGCFGIWFLDRLRSAGWRAAIEGKKEVIERISAENRSFRVELLVDKGVSRQEATRLVLENDPVPLLTDEEKDEG